MKIIALGDTHGRSFWKYVVNTQTFDKLVFIGDYFDSFDISGEVQLNNFLDIVEYKKNNPEKVILLIGNHDHHYFPEVGDAGTSGYQHKMAPSFGYVLSENKYLLQMAYKEGEYLFSHAGFAPTWLESLKKYSNSYIGDWSIEDIDYTINMIWQYQPHSFSFKNYNGRSNPYGDNVWQSPIWIRPKSLMQDGQEIKKDVIQVVGHTQQNQIDIKGKSTGGRYYFIDTLGSSREYLVIEDDKIYTEKV
jgi:hypothetical protein